VFGILLHLASSVGRVPFNREGDRRSRELVMFIFPSHLVLFNIAAERTLVNALEGSQSVNQLNKIELCAD
jgi:hypothetical protein